MLEQFSAAIEKLYAAAADFNLWEDALRAIENCTGSTGAVLNLVPERADAMPLCLAGSFSTNDCAEYALNYMWRCPRIAYGEAHPELLIQYDSMVLTEFEMDRDPTYEWFGKHGLRYYVGGQLGPTGKHRAYMSLQRSRRQGHVDARHVDQFGLILKHTEQALSLAVKLGTLEQQCRFDLALIDSLQCGLFALDCEHRVLLTNATAERLVGQGDGLALGDGRLRCSLTSQEGRLEQLIHAATRTGAAQRRGGWASVDRPSGRKPLTVFVAPIVGCEATVGLFPAKAIVIVSDPLEDSGLSEEALQELLGLSAAEARLAASLSRGHSIESASALLCIQPTTARSELKSIFRKLRLSRQQDLVGLLRSLAALPTLPL